MYQAFEISGVITKIEDVVSFSEKYKEKVFVVKYDSSPDYSYSVALTLANTKIGMIDPYAVGDSVIVNFNMSSRNVKGSYYTKLNVWKIDFQK